MTSKEAIEVIKSNYPPEQYTMLREALDLAIVALEENPKYKEALMFYADKFNYEVTGEYLNPITDYVHDIDTDQGYKARKALGILTKEDKTSIVQS